MAVDLIQSINPTRSPTYPCSCAGWPLVTVLFANIGIIFNKSITIQPNISYLMPFGSFVMVYFVQNAVKGVGILLEEKVMVDKGAKKPNVKQFNLGAKETVDKLDEKYFTSIWVENAHDFPIVVTALNQFYGLHSGSYIKPGEKIEMPIGPSFAADVFCYWAQSTGLQWEGTNPLYTMHYHEVAWTVWTGQTVTFGKKGATAGG